MLFLAENIGAGAEFHWARPPNKKTPMQSISTAVVLVDIPTDWDPRTNQQPTGLLIALPSAVPCCSSPTGHVHQIKKSADAKHQHSICLGRHSY
jgi:hypothetical protein